MKVLFFFSVCVSEDTYMCVCIYMGRGGSRVMGKVLKSLQTSKFRPTNSISFERVYFSPLSLKIVIKSESSCNF